MRKGGKTESRMSVLNGGIYSKDEGRCQNGRKAEGHTFVLHFKGAYRTLAD